MMGLFISRTLIIVLGYVYPAYECFMELEKNMPGIENLLLWCQYWILVASFTVLERMGDSLISWLPLYSEAKLAFLVYLWHPKTKGTGYVYNCFVRPFVAKHETEIDRNLLELKLNVGRNALVCWQMAASYGYSKLFEILEYVSSRSPSQCIPSSKEDGRAKHDGSHTMPTSTSEEESPATDLALESGTEKRLIENGKSDSNQHKTAFMESMQQLRHRWRLFQSAANQYSRK